LLKSRNAIAQSSESQLGKQSLVADACYSQLLLVTEEWRDGSQDCFDGRVSKATPEAAPRDVNLLFVEAFLYQHFFGAAVELTGSGARAVRKGIHKVVSTASTKSTEQIMQSYVDEQGRLGKGSPTRLFYQYYMPVDRKKAIDLMHIVKRCRA
jgi:hypothetical protein